MEDEDGTCLLDVLCDPQALNDFLHGTNESPVSLLGDGGDSPDTPPPGCVDLSFLEEALLSSPEAAGDVQALQGGGPGEEKTGDVLQVAEEAEVEVEVACDILQQSLQEADITEQTMALEAGLVQPGDSLSLYSPAPLLPPAATLPFVPKPVTLPVTPALPRDTQAAVEPPQPSLLAVGPGCPSLKPAAPPQLMGLLPGNVFPAPPPETPFSLSPAQASSMIIHKAVPGVAARPLVAPALRAAAVPGILLQRAPLPIQPKLPISIQPRLVQISPKPPGQKPTRGLTFVPGTASPNILLSQAPGPNPAAPPGQAHQQLPKPVSLQLVNQGGSFLLQPQGLFQGQNQFLLPGQCPVTISQPAGAPRPLLTPSRQGPAVHSVTPAPGQLVDGSQILTVPQRQLNFSPVFTTPTGQLALRQATVLSGPLHLQSAPPTVFQMPAQLAGPYTPGGQGQRATLVHGPALGNHITLINSSGVLPPDLTSISIVNGPSVVQGLPFTAPTPAAPAEAALSLQQASVVLLPERGVPEERSGSEEMFHQLQQPYGHIVQRVSVQPSSGGLQDPSPPVVAALQPPPEPPLVPDPAARTPKLLMGPADVTQAVEEVTQSMSQNQAFMQHLQQQEALSSPMASDLLVGALPLVPMEPLVSPEAEEPESRAQDRTVPGQDAGGGTSDRSVVSPLHSESDDTPPLCCSPPLQDTGTTESAVPQTTVPQDQYLVPHQLQVSQALFSHNPAQTPSSVSRPVSPVQVPVSKSPSVHSSVPQQQPDPSAAALAKGDHHSAVQQHTQNKPTAALAVESPPPAEGLHRPPSNTESVHMTPQADTKLAGPLQHQHQHQHQQREETLTPASRRHRFQQQLCLDHAAVQHPFTGPAFCTLTDAVRRLLPYHTCAGHLPTQGDFGLVDQEFDTVSGFLLKRTKDMINKYRQLLVREAQQESPSAEMVMLERLFLQAERYALSEDRRRVRRDPESFTVALATSASSPHKAHAAARPLQSSSGSPSSPPAWTRVSDRPPGLKTYRSSSRGALRLTIKQESGSRKVVHNSACDPGLKRDHRGQLTNGGGAVHQRHAHAPNGAPLCPQHDQGVSNGALQRDPAEEAPQTTKAPNPLPVPQPQAACFQSPPRDVSGPKLKHYRLDASARTEPRFSPPPPALQEDNVLSEHLQSAIDSILELQRLQGPSVAPARGPARAPSGPPLDQAVTSILEGHL